MALGASSAAVVSMFDVAQHSLYVFCRHGMSVLLAHSYPIMGWAWSWSSRTSVMLSKLPYMYRALCWQEKTGIISLWLVAAKRRLSLGYVSNTSCVRHSCAACVHVDYVFFALCTAVYCSCTYSPLHMGVLAAIRCF